MVVREAETVPRRAGKSKQRRRERPISTKAIDAEYPARAKAERP